MKQTHQTRPELVQDDSLEHFIPIVLEELMPQLINSQVWTSEAERKQFSEFCDRLLAVYHAQFHAHFRFLKRCYQPFNPDQETSTARTAENFNS